MTGTRPSEIFTREVLAPFRTKLGGTVGPSANCATGAHRAEAPVGPI
ncbi:hypothetical protein ACFYZJ_38910 [Streptomyces sp. NPDC001848]